MASLDAAGDWCPLCGAQYRPGFTECADCGVPLVADRPVAEAEQAGAADHAERTFVLAGWAADRRTWLDLVLLAHDVPHRWDGASLVVPGARGEEVERLVEEAEAAPPVEGPGGPEPEASPSDDVLAGPLRRLAGYFVDGLLAGSLGLVVYVKFLGRPGHGVGPQLVVAAWVAVYAIAPVVLWGRTPGKLAAGTRVVDAGDHTLPGVGQATVRWAVPAVPGMLGVLVAGGWPGLVLGVVSWLWPLAVYCPILADPGRQGLHDRTARTVVVRAAAVPPQH